MTEEKLVKCECMISKIQDGDNIYRKGAIFMWPESKALRSTSVKIIKAEPEKAPVKQEAPKEEVKEINYGVTPVVVDDETPAEEGPEDEIKEYKKKGRGRK